MVAVLKNPTFDMRSQYTMHVKKSYILIAKNLNKWPTEMFPVP